MIVVKKYLDNDIDYNRHVETLKHKTNVKMIDGEIIKNCDRYECITCKTSINQISIYSCSQSLFIEINQSLFMDIIVHS